MDRFLVNLLQDQGIHQVFNLLSQDEKRWAIRPATEPTGISLGDRNDLMRQSWMRGRSFKYRCSSMVAAMKG